jgi:predicted nucleic acid-binding protein
VSPAYIDSSALVKLIVREPETDALRRYLTSAGPLASSILATVEVSRAVARAIPESTAAMVDVFEAVNVLAFDARIAARAAALRPASLRTLDAIHLATALELAGDLSAFVSYDDRLSAAARDLGLPVVALPGEA